MKLSVVLPCYNAAGVIGIQLAALARQSWVGQWEVIAADNGSTDDTVSVVKQYADRIPHLRIVDASAQRGPAHARNIGVRAATGEAVVFCDADDEVAPGWLEAMGKALAASDFVACSLDAKKLNPEWTQIHDDFQAHGLGKLEWYPYLPHAGGSSLGVRRSVFEAVGGFDSTLRYCEDTDFCCKAQLSGTTLQFVPEAVLHVRFQTSYRGLYRQARNWAKGSVAVFARYRVRKNRGLWRWGPYWRQWKALVGMVPGNVGHAKGRARLMWHLGWQIGLFMGSMKQRMPPPAAE